MGMNLNTGVNPTTMRPQPRWPHNRLKYKIYIYKLLRYECLLRCLYRIKNF